MNIFKYIFLLGAHFRNPSLWKFYKELKLSETYTPEQLIELREKRLFAFLDNSAKYSPYFKKIFNSIGWTEGQKFNMELFYKIPVTTKEILISKNEIIHSTLCPEKLFNCETSGTSGQVLTFRRNESWDSFNRASIMRGYSWYNVKPWDFNIYFWGYNTSLLKRLKLRSMDFLVNRYRLFDYSERTMNRMIAKIKKAVYIEGYSSMIYELACAAEQQQLKSPKLKMVKGTSEKIFPHYEDKTKKVFNRKIISEYGAAETGIIAFECPFGNMHINMEGVFVEVDDSNEIIVTNFHSYSFPVIRYKLGDAVKLKKENFKCDCKMAHPVIEEVTGRVGKVIVGKNHNYPSLTFYYIFKNLFFEKGLQLNYQAHQTEKGKIEILIKEVFTDSEKELINKECTKYFGEDVEVSLTPGTNLRIYEGKLRDFITTLN